MYSLTLSCTVLFGLLGLLTVSLCDGFINLCFNSYSNFKAKLVAFENSRCIQMTPQKLSCRTFEAATSLSMGHNLLDITGINKVVPE